jgi:hypothetical protein
MAGKSSMQTGNPNRRALMILGAVVFVVVMYLLVTKVLHKSASATPSGAVTTITAVQSGVPTGSATSLPGINSSPPSSSTPEPLSQTTFRNPFQP